MRQLIILIFASILVSNLVACGPSQAELEKQRQLDSIRVADSLKREAAIQREKDSIEWYSFTSKDLAFFELHGHVKTLKTRNQFGDIILYEFDENGNLIKGNGYNPFKEYDVSYWNNSLCVVPVFKRNKQGYIISQTVRCAEGSEEYSWKDERVAKCICYEGDATAYLSYVYDERGQLVNRSGKVEDPMGDDYETQSYSYLTYDEYGNWTKRKEVYNGENSIEVVTRSITYYPFNTIQAQPQPVQQQTVNAKNSNPSRHRATIKDPDGFTNIRRGASVNSDIVGQIYEGDIFYYEVVPGSNWRKVYQNDTFLGYIYYNRIVKL